MQLNLETVGKQIQRLRKTKNLTQQELGESLGVSFQAVSKWERGETLPDTMLLPDLAIIFETTIDNILLGVESVSLFKRKTTIQDIKKGIDCFVEIGELLGEDSAFYIGAMQGVNKKMNIDLEDYLVDDYKREALVAEATIQLIQRGVYVDVKDISKNFTHEHWKKIVLEFAYKYNLE